MVLHIIRADILLIARIFPRPLGLGKILRNLQNIRAYYMLNHRIRCIYFMTYFIIGYNMKVLLARAPPPGGKEERTDDISD